MNDLDVWRAAAQLIKMYPESAAMAAANRADKAIEQGDPEGESVWKRVLKAVQELERTEPRADEKTN